MNKCEIWVSSRQQEGGIYRLQYENGRFTVLSFTPAPYPSYFVRSGNTLHVLLNTAMGGEESDLLTSFLLDGEGELVSRGTDCKTHGVSSCHLCEKDGEIFVASYVSGNLFKTPDVVLQHSGCGPHKNQASAHPHCVTPTPDGKYLLVADLGTDRVTVYTPDLKEVSFASVPAGHGCRHLAFYDERTLFAVNELASTVTVFDYADGKLYPRQTVSSLPKGYCGESYAGAIRVDGNRVFVSNRGHDSVALLVYEGGMLSFVDTCSCGGNFPRDIYLCGENLFCANQNSHTLTVIKVIGNTMSLTDAVFSVVSPLCVLPV